MWVSASSLTDHHHEQVPCDMVLAHDDDLALARHRRDRLLTYV